MPPDDLSEAEVRGRLRAQRIDFTYRLLLARVDGVFDLSIAGELADLLAQPPYVDVYPDESEGVA
jgi:hypothetical protein